MAVEIVRVRAEMKDELGRILFEAFKRVMEAHGTPPDFPSLEVARHVMGMLLDRPEFYGVAAVDGRRVVGSNFVMECDEVGAVGPITVDPDHQAGGVGRRLMEAIIARGRERRMPLRLLQDAFNMVSLSLYTRLGFGVREPVIIVTMQPAAEPDPTVRVMRAEDADACDRLCREVWRISRRHEITLMREAGFNPLVRHLGGELVGYQTGGMLGHGAARSIDDALVLMEQVARLGPPLNRFFVPVRHEALHRAVLERGGRAVRMMSLMSYGEYVAPTGVWLPSVGM